MQAFGVDIGGSGIKGAPVDLIHGRLTGERFRIPTPDPATPGAVARVVLEVIQHFGWGEGLGCTFPGVVKDGVVRTSAHLDPSWVGTDSGRTLSHAVGAPVTVINDADAAGLAEMRFGAGRGQRGVVLVLTLGTGIGSALFVDGTLVPNTEFGHLEVEGKDAELRASYAAREAKGWSWQKWTKRVNRYLEAVEMIVSPDVIIIGGGASNDAEHFMPLLRARAPLLSAGLRNQAGIIGAAMAAASAARRRAAPPARRGRRTAAAPRLAR